MNPDVAVVASADVGDHYGAGKQAHVPLDVLELLDAEPGDRVVFVAHRDDGIRIERGEPLPEDDPFVCSICGHPLHVLERVEGEEHCESCRREYGPEEGEEACR